MKQADGKRVYHLQSYLLGWLRGERSGFTLLRLDTGPIFTKLA